MKYFLGMLALFLLIFVFVFIYTNKGSVVIGNTKIYVEVVNTDKQREQGLSGRDSLNENAGMLFDMQRETNDPFWMIDMNFPLDIIFLNKRNEIIDIKKNMQPCRDSSDCPLIFPTGNYYFVLEVNSGFADKVELKVGDVMKTNRFTSVP